MSALLLTVLAFSDPGAFLAPAELGGGNGNHFTGSRSSHFDCSVCHDPAPELSLTVASEPDGLFTTGYTPGSSYTLTFTLSDRGVVGAFGAELAVRAGAAAGTLTPVAATGDFLCLDGPNGTAGSDPVQVFAGADGTPGAVVAALACKNSPRSWRVSWAAPLTDVGPVTLFASAVAGNLDGSNRGDRTTSVVLGFPSPSSANALKASCASTPGAAWLLPLALWALWGRRRRAAWLLVLLLPALAGAAPQKKKRAPPKAPVEAPPPAVEKPAEPPPPAPPPPVAPPAPRPAPEEAVEPAPAVTAIAEAAPDAVHAQVDLGFGVRDLVLSSPSLASPLRAQLPFPMGRVRLGMFPMRLLQTTVLQGLELEGAYLRGWVLGPLPLGSAQVLPADGWVTLGYQVGLGPVTLTPRAMYRVQVGGAEKNFSFDDVYLQSVGGELGLAGRFGAVSVSVVPRVGVVLDTGTLAVAGYGPQHSGLSLGGQAAVSVELGAGFTLGAEYGFTRSTVGWSGHGTRALEAVSAVDLVQQGALTVRLAR